MQPKLIFLRQSIIAVQTSRCQVEYLALVPCTYCDDLNYFDVPITDAINYANAISAKLKFPTTCKKTRKWLANFIGSKCKTRNTFVHHSANRAIE